MSEKSIIQTDIKDIKDLSLRKIYKEIIDLELPRGKKAAPSAKDALTQSGWRKWIDNRERKIARVEEFKLNNSIAGKIVDLTEFNRQEFLTECYEIYLRMAQLRQRSKTTFVVENGRTVGKPIFDMEFDEYLQDCLRQLHWKKTKDLPALKERERMGLIGIRDSEYDKTMALVEMSIQAIKGYLAMPSRKRFIYV